MSIQNLKNLSVKMVPFLFMGTTATYLFDVWGLHWLNQFTHYFVLCVCISLFLLTGILSLRQKMTALSIKNEPKILRLRQRMRWFTWFMLGLALVFFAQALLDSTRVGIGLMVTILPMWLFCYWLNTLVLYLTAWGQSQDFK